MASAARPIYNFLFRKNYTMLAVVFGSAFAFEMYEIILRKVVGGKDGLIDYRGFDNISDKIWDTMNKGRQWKDIRAKYVQADGDDE